LSWMGFLDRALERRVTAEGRGLGFEACMRAWGAVCVLGAVCSLWIVNQVLVRFGRAGTPRWVLLGRNSGWAGSAGVVRNGLAQGV